MSNLQTSTKQGELLNIQLNAEENQNKANSSELFTRKEIKGSPFLLISQESKHFAIFMNERITPILSSEEEIYLFLAENQYEIMCIMIVIILDKHKLISV